MEENIERALTTLLNEFEERLNSLTNQFNVDIVMSEVSFNVVDKNPGGQVEDDKLNFDDKINTTKMANIISFAGKYNCPRNSDGQRVCRKGD